MLLAMLRRLITTLIPQSFIGTVGMSQVFKFTQHFDPFAQKISLDFTSDYTNALDKRIGIAAAILICAIEGRQSD